MRSDADLGEAIVFIAKMAGLSQHELAVAVGVHDQTISGWKKGRSRPSPQVMESVVRALHRSKADIEYVATFFGDLRHEIEDACKTASSVAETPAGSRSFADERDRELGRALMLLLDLLAKARALQGPYS
jgi:transcriptional regulator with XRE-family HTH domain